MLAVFFVMVGTDTEMYITMIAFGVLPVLAQSVYLAVRDVPEERLYKAYTLGASHTEVLWNVIARQILPKVIDALRRHDAESLGGQALELIRRCEDIARNIESELEISQRLVDNLVDMLLQRSREYHQKLQAAAQASLPGNVFIYGGKSILKSGTRLDFVKHQDTFRQSVENWLYELIQQDRLPEVNPRVGNRLGPPGRW